MGFTRTTLGSPTLVRRLASFNVVDSSYAPGMVLNRHAHRRHSFTLIRRGTYRERVDGRDFCCLPGTILYTPAEREHANEVGPEGVRSLIVEIADPAPRFHRLALPAAARVIAGSRAAHLSAMIEQEHAATDAASGVALEGLGYELLACLVRSDEPAPTSRRPAWLDEVLRVVTDRFREPLRPAAIAGAVGVHPVHLARVFRKHFDCTLGEFQRRLRVQHAARLLRGSDSPVAEVAQRCGFFDQSHFCRCFKRLEGVTPGEYRRQARS